MRVNDTAQALPQPGPEAQPATQVFAKAGDHLPDVSARHGVNLADLNAANPGLNGRTALLAGEAINIPAAPSPQTSSRTSRVYAEHPGAVANPEALVGQPVILNKKGSAQCAELVKVEAHAPNTQPQNWQKGTALTPANVTTMAPGTPVASGWNQQGYYPNNSTGQHTGLFAGAVRDKAGQVVGFKIVEQYSSLSKIQERNVYFEPAAMKKPDTYYYNASQYATVKW